MTDSTPPRQVNPLNLMATGLTGQGLGSALAIIYLAFHHIDPANGIDRATLESALTEVFSNGVSLIFMIGHILLAKYLPSNQ